MERLEDDAVLEPDDADADGGEVPGRPAPSAVEAACFEEGPEGGFAGAP